MTANTVALKSTFDVSRLRDPTVLRRAVLFGAGWGLAFASAMTAMSAYTTDCICIDQTVWMTGISLAVGVFAIGPATALVRPA